MIEYVCKIPVINTEQCFLGSTHLVFLCHVIGSIVLAQTGTVTLLTLEPYGTASLPLASVTTILCIEEKWFMKQM